jgi:hypothetical protein
MKLFRKEDFLAEFYDLILLIKYSTIKNTIKELWIEGSLSR